MTQADIDLAMSLTAGMPAPAAAGATDIRTAGKGRMAEEWAFRRRANDAVRDVQQAGQIPLVAGAGTLIDFNRFGVPQGYMWAIYRITANGFSAGTVQAFRDSVAGEPLLPFTAAAVNLLGQSSTILHPMSQVVWSATGITGAVNVWLDAVQFESWLLPWFVGANW